MSDACLFCKIARHELDAAVVYEDDDVLAFKDIQPQAPVHVLVIPKRHLATLNDLRPDHGDLIVRLVLAATKIARDQGVADDGYRLVWNCQEGAGQSVFHLHLHLLGGRRLNWPPG
jgi:histidine triad (HIT) family protein